MRSLVVVQDTATGTGLLCEALADLGLPATCVVPATDGLDADAADDADLLVLLGGPGSLVDGASPWQGEVDLVRRAADRGTPVLGICFGAQLLSVALGGGVRRGRRRLGWHWTESSHQAWESGERFYVNGDYAQPPSEAQVWSQDADGVLAFACGPAIGVQCHPEVTPAMVHAWADHLEIDDPHALARSVAERSQGTAAAARRLIALAHARRGTPHPAVQ